MYRVFLLNQIPVIRIGLQPTDLIAEGKEVLYGPFHPAFRQLVETSFFLDEIKREVNELKSRIRLEVNQEITLLCNPKDLSQVVGHNRSNIIELKKEYPYIKVIPDERIEPMVVKCVVG